MPTIREYITATLNRYNIELSEAEIDAKLIDQGLNPGEEYTSPASRQIKLAIVGVIPELLLTPDISEAQFSIKFDRSAVMKFYSLLCAELGIEDKLNPQPKIRNKSYLW